MDIFRSCIKSHKHFDAACTRTAAILTKRSKTHDANSVRCQYSVIYMEYGMFALHLRSSPRLMI